MFNRPGVSVVGRYSWRPLFAGATITVYAEFDQDAQLLVNKLRDYIPATVRVTHPRR